MQHKKFKKMGEEQNIFKHCPFLQMKYNFFIVKCYLNIFAHLFYQGVVGAGASVALPPCVAAGRIS